MLDDYKITENEDLPANVWQFLRDKRFFGIIIPKKYGGLAFSAYAHSQIILKVASRSAAAGVTVMVPNSLGPAELLLKYGTEKQKDHYLKNLAKGKEIPCFALTGPYAGSDAGSIPDEGIICEQTFNGKKTLGLRVTWEKRYITLGPIATVLGLAFKAYDPDQLLGDKEFLGITCALIPTNTQGVTIGNRHKPMGLSFMNGPNSGKDVFIPMDWVIGGQDMIGHGWRMLVECLSVGRGISLPSLGAGSGKQITRVTSAYARVRKQFKIPIAKFEGVEESLGRIFALTYMMDASRTLATNIIDQGEAPSVITAMVKYFNTEGMRQVINDSLDIHGGRGICKGPSNYLALPYQAIPIAITVEGANILTRNMIIFGQGAMRCHPHLLNELKAIAIKNDSFAIDQFDDELMKHIGYTTVNKNRAFLYGLTRGTLAGSPVSGLPKKYYCRLARMSAAYAFLTDVSLMLLGGSIKRMERLSARFADALMYMYVCSAVLKHYEDQGRLVEDQPLMEWSAKYCLYNVQNALDEILRNFPNMWAGQALRAVVFPLGRRYRYPNDKLTHNMVTSVMDDDSVRDRLTDGVYINFDKDDITGRMEVARKLIIETDELEKQLIKNGKITKSLLTEPFDDKVIEKLQKDGDITKEQAKTIIECHQAVRLAIDVDEFKVPKKASKKTAVKTKKTTAK